MNWKFWEKKEKEEEQKPKGIVKEWADAIVFAVVAAFSFNPNPLLAARGRVFPRESLLAQGRVRGL